MAMSRSPDVRRQRHSFVGTSGRPARPDAKGKRKLVFSASKILAGKKFFLDLPGISQKRVSKIKEDLVCLGAEVCEFLCKEISYLVTSRKEAYYSENQSGPSALSPSGISTPSPFTKTFSKSPWMVSPREVDSPRSLDARKPLLESQARGKKILEEAAATHHQGSSNIVQLALKFKVKIRPLDRILTWLEANKSKKIEKKSVGNAKVSHSSHSVRVWKLESPFVKVEDMSRKYKPLWANLRMWPWINFEAAEGECPFDSTPRRRPKESKTVKRDRKTAAKRRCGFCECCMQNFDSLDTHVKSRKHQEFALNDDNYKEVDEAISTGLSFDDFLAREMELVEEPIVNPSEVRHGEKEESDGENDLTMSEAPQVKELDETACNQETMKSDELSLRKSRESSFYRDQGSKCSLPKNDLLILDFSLYYEEMIMACGDRTLRNGKVMMKSPSLKSQQSSQPRKKPVASISADVTPNAMQKTNGLSDGKTVISATLAELPAARLDVSLTCQLEKRSLRKRMKVMPSLTVTSSPKKEEERRKRGPFDLSSSDSSSWHP